MNKRRSVKDYKRIGGYDWGLYYNKKETDKLTIENLEGAIKLLELTIKEKKSRNPNYFYPEVITSDVKDI